MVENTRLDFSFIVAYTLTGYFLARLLAGAGQRRLAWQAGRMMLAAGAFDAVENCLLLQVLDGSMGWRPTLMALCAGVKFSLLLAAVAWAARIIAARARGASS